jgi:hypothetical protein
MRIERLLRSTWLVEISAGTPLKIAKEEEAAN